MRTALHLPSITLLFPSLLGSTALDAQDLKLSHNYTVEVGKPYPVVDGKKYYVEAKNGMVCVKVDGKRWILQRISAETLTQVSRKEYEDMPEDMELEMIDTFGDRMFLFYSLWDKKNEREQLFQREIDPERGVFLNKGVRLLSIQGKVTGSMMMAGFYRFHVTDKFDMLFSEDEKHMLVQYRKRAGKNEKDPPNVLSMAMFDTDLKMLWQDDVRLPYPQNRMSVVDFTINDAGELCVIASVTTPGSSSDPKTFAHHYEFLRGGANGAQWTTSTLELSGKYLRSMTLFENDDVMRAGGFYANDKGKYGVDGVFTCGFDANGDITNAVFHEIPREIINMYTEAKVVKKNAKQEAKGEDIGLSDMTLVRIMVDGSGGLILVGEKRYMTVSCVTDSRGGQRCYDVYHADDLLVTRVGPDGGLIWMDRIPKRLASGTPIGKSFMFVHSDDMNHFIRFDVDENLDIKRDEVPKAKGTPIVMVDRINDSTGEVKREAILNTEEVKGIKLYQLSPERLVRVSDDEMLMEAYKKDKEDILIRIKANE